VATKDGTAINVMGATDTRTRSVITEPLADVAGTGYSSDGKKLVRVARPQSGCRRLKGPAETTMQSTIAT
jgi:hypothetical protein